MSTPIRRICSVCCANASSGQATAEPAITLTKSRRCIASPTLRKGIVPTATTTLEGLDTTRLMSALGQKQTCAVQQAMSALPPIAIGKADIRCLERDVLQYSRQP